MAVPRKEFIAAWNDLQDVGEMASRFGVRPDSVVRRLHVLRQEGLVTYNPERKLSVSDEQLIESWRRLRSYLGVSKELGVPKGYVKRRVDRLTAQGVSLPKPKKTSNGARKEYTPTPEQITEAAAEVRKSWSRAETAKRCEGQRRVEAEVVKCETLGFRDTSKTI